MDGVRISFDENAIAVFCEHWVIDELSLFGSVLRGDFGPRSDVDVLILGKEGVEWGLMEWMQMEEELGNIFGREVDLVNRICVEASCNILRRKEILSTARVIYSNAVGPSTSANTCNSF